MYRNFSFLLCLLFIFSSLHTAVAAEKRIALVVGNSQYSSSQLTNPKNDATDMRDALQGLGFDVELALDLSFSEMSDEITRFGQKLNSADVGLFFYAGHGVQVDGVNYLIPTNIELSEADNSSDNIISTSYILKKMELAGNGVNIMVLDACRNNPGFEDFKASPSPGLAVIEAPTASFIAYSTAPGNVASDGSGRNSPYTQSVLKNIEMPGQTIEQMFKKVRVAVVQDTNGLQVPWENSSLLGEFYFVEPVVSDALGEATTYYSAEQFELDFWKSVQAEATREMYESYLKKFPKGNFSLSAKDKLKRLGNGLLTIHSNVFGDSIKVDGEYRGTSKSVLSLEEGEYDIEVSKPGFDTLSHKIKIASKQHMDLQFTLQASSSIIASNTSMPTQKTSRGIKLPEPEVVIKELNDDITDIVPMKGMKNNKHQPKVNVLVQYNTKETVVKKIRKKIEPIINMEFVKIDTGCFKMGSPPLEEGRSNDEKEHKVCLNNDYWMGRYEVTQEQWQKVMGYSPSFFSGCGKDCPVERVSWNEIQGFIFKLNLQTGQKYRLPTEAEWEYAARSGRQTSLYAGESELLGQNNATLLSDIAWYSGNSEANYPGGRYCEDWDEKEFEAVRCGTQPVGQKQPNQWSLSDMMGNVSEWTNDIYGNLSTRDVSDPSGATTGNKYVVKGGSWEGSLSRNRPASRYGYTKNKKLENVGFRLVVSEE
ncbi:MAG: SUMF1/EgtB/PvdO family nonheme iron enzyme [Gammaproteobacteria bacterium]|nr:SUMF1/EgtB/PvdO family nonheme iron enzyme [Gammaproteobacteria bacterium]